MRGITGPAMMTGALLLCAAACGGETQETTTSTVPGPGVTSTTVPATTTSTTTSTTAVSPVSGTLPPDAALQPTANVSTVGMGPVRIGMTVAEASEAAGVPLLGEPDPLVNPDCYHVVANGLDGVAFMVVDELIARVEIIPPSSVTTRSGAGIGMTEDELRNLFPGRIEDASEYTVDGRAVMYVPRDAEDADYRVIFELSEDGVVASYRAGILPAVGFGEGCV